MKIQLDVEKYPQLQNLFENDKERFAEVMRATMSHADKALQEKRDTVSEDIYKMDYFQMVDDVMDTFFDVEGIAAQNENRAEAEGLKQLGTDLHPLTIFTDDAPVYNAKGENVSPAAWIQQDEFNLKNWLYALFYGARFVSWKELSDYLALEQYDLIEVLKARNFEQLAYLQEELQEQVDNGIPRGKLIPGTGRLDTGD